VTDAPDPLGKRALFWAPAERDEDGPRGPSELTAPGKHALFSEEARVAAAAAAGQAPTRRTPSGGPTGRPVSSATPRAARLGTATRRGRTVVRVDCSSCSTRSQVHLAEFALLHLPVWLWFPGRGYTRFMTCPACRRRTWVSASWTPWAR